MTITLSNLLSIIVIPAISAAADRKASKKYWLWICTLVCVFCTGLLFFSTEGSLVYSGFLVVLSNCAFNSGVALNSAFLSELAKPDSVGKVSGIGWSLGYLGGIISLAVCLLIVVLGGQKGIAASSLVPYCMAFVALFYLVFALPMLTKVRERSLPQTASAVSKSLSESITGVCHTLKTEKQFFLFCLCGLFYQAGIAVVITLAAVYAELTMKFSQSETILLILLVNITAAAGAFCFGYIQDAIGHKKTLALTILLWIVMALIAGFTHSKGMFWVAANLAGIAMGSSQSAGRAVVSLFAKDGSLAQYYSAWNVAVWGANILGPITFGALTWISGGDQRLAILITSLYFVVGLVILFIVRFPASKVN